MTWLLLLDWVNDPTRTVQELQTACSGLGLAPTGNRNQLTNKLRAHIASQPNLNNTATWTPPGWTPPAPTPTTDPVPVESNNGHDWRLPITIIVLAVLAFAALMVWTPWNNDSDSKDSSPATTAVSTDDSTTATVAPTTPPTDATTAPTTATGSPNTGMMPPAINTYEVGTWTIDEIDLGNDPIVADWLSRLQDPDPSIWTTFPNIPNPDVSEFDVANGMEYGVDNVPFCQQDMRCDFVVPAQHYRLITADYSFQGMTCQGDDGNGCVLLLINVGDQSFTWRDQMADNGFNVSGRYWNGDALDEGVWGLLSNVSANMLNMPTASHPGEVLNDGVMTNGGANCGVPQGCKIVNITVVVHAGDRILAVAKTTVSV